MTPPLTPPKKKKKKKRRCKQKISEAKEETKICKANGSMDF